MNAEYSSKNYTFYLKKKLLSLCSNKGKIAGEANCVFSADAHASCLSNLRQCNKSDDVLLAAPPHD
jgi:hypothetical protein